MLPVGDGGCSLGIIAAHDGSIYTIKKVSEPNMFYSVTQDDLDVICGLYHDEKKLSRAIRERMGYEIEHIA